MRQFVMTAPGKIERRDVPVPEVGANEVLLETRRVGICGSDIHVYHGKHPYTSYPVVQGHEVSGEVVKVGTAVKDVLIGGKATIIPQVVCGSCLPCTQGRSNICDSLKVMGFQTTGAASDYFAVPSDRIVQLPQVVDFDQGAMVEPLAVAVHALGRLGDVTGRKILVLGAGPIGNLVAQAAKGLGASSVMITDLSAFRLQIAGRCGIEQCLDSSGKDVPAEVASRFGKDRADAILECVGAEATLDQAIRSARKGTDIIVVGVFGDKAKVDIGLVQDRELRLIGTLMYRAEDYCGALDLLEKGKVTLAPLITRHFPAYDYPKAYEYVERMKDQSMKIMMDFKE
jgi:L-iditol 2-dehydrogenase